MERRDRKKNKLGLSFDLGKIQAWVIFRFLPDPLYLWLLRCVSRQQSDFLAQFYSVKALTYLKQEMHLEAYFCPAHVRVLSFKTMLCGDPEPLQQF